MANREQVEETATKEFEYSVSVRRERLKMCPDVSVCSAEQGDDEGGTMTGIWQRLSALSLRRREGHFGERQDEASWCHGHGRNELKHSFMYTSRSHSFCVADKAD